MQDWQQKEPSFPSVRPAFSTGVEVESTGGLFGGFFRFVILAGGPDLRRLGRFRASCAGYTVLAESVGALAVIVVIICVDYHG